MPKMNTNKSKACKFCTIKKMKIHQTKYELDKLIKELLITPFEKSPVGPSMICIKLKEFLLDLNTSYENALIIIH